MMMLILFEFMEREHAIIDKKYIDMFWKSLKQGKWIYLSPNLIKGTMYVIQYTYIRWKHSSILL